MLRMGGDLGCPRPGTSRSAEASALAEPSADSSADRLTLVVSPLIALIKDQVDALRALGIAQLANKKKFVSLYL